MTRPFFRQRAGARSATSLAVTLLLASLASAAAAQSQSASISPSTGVDASPWYLGASEALTHESNVYRVPLGPGDSYSSTTLLGGFDQRLGRQRLFGSADVSANRYRDQKALDNTSYDLATGLEWETVGRLSGNVDASLNQNPSAPPVGTGTPVPVRNLVRTEKVAGRARWGGDALLTVEAALGYTKVHQSADEYVTSNTMQNSESLGVFYRPSGSLRIGLAGRYERTRTPQALFDPDSGGYEANAMNARYVDLTADYTPAGPLVVHTRLSHTRQTNTNPVVTSADFSGLTGSLGVEYRTGGKLSFNAFASRDAGLNGSLFNGFAVSTSSGNGSSGSSSSPVVTPVSGVYENSQIANSIGAGVDYAATAKISANAGYRYARSKLTTTLLDESLPGSTDSQRFSYFGVDYAITRGLSASCRYSHEKRSVSGGDDYGYTDNTLSCLGRFTWH